MNFGKNLQILRKMTNMTQEELAEKMSVSRQTISKWELGSILPEVEKLVDLSKMFNCSIDQLLKDNMDFSNEVYSDIKIVTVEPFCYIRYEVISREPEEDAIAHVEGWAKQLNIEKPYIIGWDFPKVSQEQANVFHMHGYGAALSNINYRKINEKTIINIHSNSIRKSIFFCIFLIKAPHSNPVFVRINNPVFADSCRTVFEKLDEIIHTAAAW